MKMMLDGHDGGWKRGPSQAATGGELKQHFLVGWEQSSTHRPDKGQAILERNKARPQNLSAILSEVNWSWALHFHKVEVHSRIMGITENSSRVDGAVSNETNPSFPFLPPAPFWIVPPPPSGPESSRQDPQPVSTKMVGRVTDAPLWRPFGQLSCFPELI